MNHKEAVDAFMERMVTRAFHGAISTSLEFLEKGPVVRNPSREETGLHEWYINLNVLDQEMIKNTIEKTAFSAVFGCLVVLDNKTGGYALEGEISDFALYVHQYNNSEDYLADRIGDKERINNHLMDLHDLLREHIEKQSKKF